LIFPETFSINGSGNPAYLHSFIILIVPFVLYITAFAQATPKFLLKKIPTFEEAYKT
jgi:hypothetical protein